MGRMSRWNGFLDDHPWMSRVLSMRKYLPPLNFITIHYAYFIVVCLISSVIFWRSSDSTSPISYTDSLFLVVSAMTEAGLNTVNLSALTTWQQTILFLLIMLGSTIWVSMWTVLARKHVFEKRFDDIVRIEIARSHSQRRNSISLNLPKLRKAISFRKAQTAMPRPRRALSLPDLDPVEPPKNSPEPKPKLKPEPEPEPSSPDDVDRHIVFVDTPQRAEGSSATSTGTPYFNQNQPTRRNGVSKTPAGQDRVELSIRHFLGSRSFSRNGQFHSLTSEERENLGGCEYRALKALAVLVPLYFFLWQFLGILGECIRTYFRLVLPGGFFFMLACLNSIDWVAFEVMNIGNQAFKNIPTGSRILDGLFQALAVRSGGFYVVPISQVYIGLQVLYVTMMYISVYPVVITMRHSNIYEERSLGIYSGDGVFKPDAEAAVPLLPADGHVHAPNTNLMPSTAPTLVRRLSRSSAAVDIGHALQRTFTWNGVGAPPPMHSNKSYKGHTLNRSDGSSRRGFISQQIHGQMAHDIWWLVLAVMVITTIETSNFMDDPVTFSVFNIIFEVVSAYGTVGISVGIPTDAYSFSGAWHTSSKLVLCLVMLRGRHRGLPVALDHAVRLPGEHLHRDEEEDHQIRRTLTGPRMDLNS
ncbi:hypothetical protein CEP52_003799 [Fusarium oligoseptatum]|uniref:Potassium transport protein n=1 Tax=Fusarium oligoseptatum TaxID=2604345 RepID=A0A428U728_9HYPO|nr:hypothetical protein CEP52_003799 [Fusarium oligoseptatum]